MVQKLLLCEAVSRVVKNELSLSMREKTKELKLPLEVFVVVYYYLLLLIFEKKIILLALDPSPSPLSSLLLLHFIDIIF